MWASKSRKDVEPFGEENSVNLYRGVAYTPDQILEFQENVESKITLWGFTSASLD